MTALGGGILGWLDDALRQREHSARLAESEGGQQWSEDPFVYGVRDQTHTLAIRARENRTSLLAHIALNDPGSVLRRCAADRRIIERHQPINCRDFGCDCDTCCATCRWTESQETGREPVWGSVDTHVFPCPTIRDLADGYGVGSEQTSPGKGDQVT